MQKPQRLQKEAVVPSTKLATLLVETHKKKCPHCHKHHKSECRLKGKPGDKICQTKQKFKTDLNQLVEKAVNE